MFLCMLKLKWSFKGQACTEIVVTSINVLYFLYSKQARVEHPAASSIYNKETQVD